MAKGFEDIRARFPALSRLIEVASTVEENPVSDEIWNGFLAFLEGEAVEKLREALEVLRFGAIQTRAEIGFWEGSLSPSSDPNGRVSVSLAEARARLADIESQCTFIESFFEVQDEGQKNRP